MQAVSPNSSKSGAASAIPPARFHIRAFTLIELLVVIAIISVLVSVLLPSLGQAKKLAKSMVCTSNVRSIAVAWHVYLAEHDESFPLYYRLDRTAGGTLIPRSQNLQWFYGGRQPCGYDEKYGQNMDYRPLNTYVDHSLTQEQGTGLFECAADGQIRHAITGKSNTGNLPTYAWYGNSYVMNAALLLPYDQESGVRYERAMRLSRVDVPFSDLLLTGDAQWYFTVNGIRLWDAGFHNDQDRMSIAFLDGHAAITKLIPGEANTRRYLTSPYQWALEEEQAE